jgi:hypothetical protein
MLKRLFITTADIQLLTGKSYKSAQRELRCLRDTLNKEKHLKITFKEYANYNDISIDDIYNRIKS